MHLIPNCKPHKQASWRAYKRWWWKQQYTEVWYIAKDFSFPFDRPDFADGTKFQVHIVNNPQPQA